MPKALAAAQRAIQLDPQNGEAYTELGSVQTIYEWDWTAAEQNLTRGISLNPNDSIAEFKYAVYLDAVDRPQDAVTHMRRALAARSAILPHQPPAGRHSLPRPPVRCRTRPTTARRRDGTPVPAPSTTT